MSTGGFPGCQFDMSQTHSGRADNQPNRKGRVRADESKLFSPTKKFSTAMLRRGLSQLSQPRLGFLPALQTLQNPAFLSCRKYSLATPPTADMNASVVTVENTKSPKPLTPAPQLVFGHTFTGWLNLCMH